MRHVCKEVGVILYKMTNLNLYSTGLRSATATGPEFSTAFYLEVMSVGGVPYFGRYLQEFWGVIAEPRGPGPRSC